MDMSWPARAEEPTLWHTYLEAQSLKCCVLLAAGRFGVHLSALPFCVVGLLPAMSLVLYGVNGGSIGLLDHSNTRV